MLKGKPVQHRLRESVAAEIFVDVQVLVDFMCKRYLNVSPIFARDVKVIVRLAGTLFDLLDQHQRNVKFFLSDSVFFEDFWVLRGQEHLHIGYSV